MNLNKKIGLVAGAASAAVAGMAVSGEKSPKNHTDARIVALENQINTLMEETDRTWLTDERAEEIRALVQETIDDASTRTSLLANGGSAGWDDGFYLQSDDGAFKLKIGALSQFRAVWNSRDDSGDDDSIFGFENSRTRLNFAGNLFGQDFTYRIQGDFKFSTGNFTLLDAWGHYKLNDTWGVVWGQMKAPFLREEILENSTFQFVDRSYVHALTTAGYTQGVALDWHSGDNFRGWFAFTDGLSASVTGPNADLKNTSALASGGNEYALTARAEWLVSGEQGWGQFEDFASWSDDAYGQLLGGAIHFQESESGTTAAELEVLTWTVDSMTELGGANIFASLTGVHTDSSDNAVPRYDQYGLVVQGGAFLDPDKIELVGRWEYYDFDDALSTGCDDEINLLTFGVNVYWHGHAKKWTTDVIWANDSIPASAENLGILADAADQDGQVVLRSQVQFKF